MNRIYLLIIIGIVCLSCSKNNSGSYYGTWIFDRSKIVYSDTLIGEVLSSNLIVFGDNNYCEVPYDFRDESWEWGNASICTPLEKGINAKIVIESNNHYFNDTFDIHFVKSEKIRGDTLVLNSNNMSLKLVRQFQ